MLLKRLINTSQVKQESERERENEREGGREGETERETRYKSKQDRNGEKKKFKRLKANSKKSLSNP